MVGAKGIRAYYQVVGANPFRTQVEYNASDIFPYFLLLLWRYNH